MSQLRVVGQMKVGSFRKKLEKVLGALVEVYESDGTPADNEKKVSQVRDFPPAVTSLRFVGQTKIQNIEKMVWDNWGLNIRVFTKEGQPADRETTLGEIRRGVSTPGPVETVPGGRGHLSKIDVMLIDSISDELRDEGDAVSIAANTVGGELLQIYCLVEVAEDEAGSEEDLRMQFLSRHVHIGAGLDGEEVERSGWQLIEENYHEDMEGNNNPGFNGRFLAVINELLEGAEIGDSDQFRADMEPLIEVIEEAIPEGPQKLHRLQVPGWTLGEISEVPFEDLDMEEPEDLMGTVAVNYTPAYDVDEYVLDCSDFECPVKKKEDGDWPEWHDEVDTLFVYSNQEVLFGDD